MMLGSIVTVAPEEAAAVGQPGLRRWLYNRHACGRCGGRVTSWQIQSRTCYACAHCQPLEPGSGASEPRAAAPPALFNSHCATESLAERLATPQKLRLAELRAALADASLPTSGNKPVLVARLQEFHLSGEAGRRGAAGERGAPAGGAAPRMRAMRSARAAAADKVAANESRAVEHVAEMEDLDDGAPEWVVGWAAEEGEAPLRADESDDELDGGVQAAILESVREAAAAATEAAPISSSPASPSGRSKRRAAAPATTPEAKGGAQGGAQGGGTATGGEPGRTAGKRRRSA